MLQQQPGVPVPLLSGDYLAAAAWQSLLANPAAFGLAPFAQGGIQSGAPFAASALAPGVHPSAPFAGSLGAGAGGAFRGLARPGGAGATAVPFMGKGAGLPDVAVPFQPRLPNIHIQQQAAAPPTRAPMPARPPPTNGAGRAAQQRLDVVMEPAKAKSGPAPQASPAGRPLPAEPRASAQAPAAAPAAPAPGPAAPAGSAHASDEQAADEDEEEGAVDDEEASEGGDDAAEETRQVRGARKGPRVTCARGSDGRHWDAAILITIRARRRSILATRFPFAQLAVFLQAARGLCAWRVQRRNRRGGRKQFVCTHEGCGRGFSQKSNMRRHM